RPPARGLPGLVLPGLVLVDRYGRGTAVQDLDLVSAARKDARAPVAVKLDAVAGQRRGCVIPAVHVLRVARNGCSVEGDDDVAGDRRRDVQREETVVAPGI